jgi:hypothetical protein
VSGPRRPAFVGAALLVAAAASVLAGWLGASRATFPSDALSYVVSGGLGGLFVAGAGVTLLLTDHFDRTLRDLEGAKSRLIRPDR